METSIGGSQVWFRPTCWTIVLEAKKGARKTQALDRLIRTYWKPVYFFLRRGGKGVEDAKDVTQEFFTRLLEEDFLRSVSPEKGRFRTFVLAALNHFLANERRAGRALKRGGGIRWMDFDQAESAHADTPERTFDRDWAASLIQEAMSRLKDENAAREDFDRLAPYILRGTRHYAELARELRITEKELSRRIVALRTRLQLLIRSAVLATVAGDNDLQDEIREISKLI